MASRSLCTGAALPLLIAYDGACGDAEPPWPIARQSLKKKTARTRGADGQGRSNWTPFRRQALNDDPQPQVRLARGLSKRKPPACKPST
jgi:hypothetical protein